MEAAELVVGREHEVDVDVAGERDEPGEDTSSGAVGGRRPLSEVCLDRQTASDRALRVAAHATDNSVTTGVGEAAIYGPAERRPIGNRSSRSLVRCGCLGVSSRSACCGRGRQVEFVV